MVEDAAAVIRRARTQSGLSQREMARRAGVTQPVISAYESGRRDPTVTTLRKLVEAAGYDLTLTLVPRPDRRLGLPDTPLGRLLRRRRAAITAAAERRGAHNVRVFGSAGRGEDTADSDVDLLVDLEPGVGLLALIGLEREIAAILRRDVDVVPASGLKPAIADRILAEAVPL